MRYLRAFINSVQTKSLRCNIDKEEIREPEISEYVKDGEAKFQEWIKNPMKATFSLKDPKLYDFALSQLNKKILLGIEEATIVSIEPIELAQKCHFCNNATFKADFLGTALCQQCYIYAAQFRGTAREKVKFLEVTQELTVKARVQIPVNSPHSIEANYLIDGKPHRWLPGDKKDEDVQKTIVKYTYYAHPERICNKCLEGKEVWKVHELLRNLQTEFQESREIYGLHSIPIKSE